MTDSQLIVETAIVDIATDLDAVIAIANQMPTSDHNSTAIGALAERALARLDSLRPATLRVQPA